MSFDMNDVFAVSMMYGIDPVSVMGSFSREAKINAAIEIDLFMIENGWT